MLVHKEKNLNIMADAQHVTKFFGHAEKYLLLKIIEYTWNRYCLVNN